MPHLGGSRLGRRWLWLGRGWRFLSYRRNICRRHIFLLGCWRLNIFFATMLVLFARILQCENRPRALHPHRD